jgi:hypothetical protein
VAATGNYVLDKGYDAAAAITKFCAVKRTANAEEVTPVTAATDVPLGVAQFGVSAPEILKGKGASVRLAGITEMVVGTTLTDGTHFLVGIDAAGKAKPATTGERVIGILVKGAAANGRATVALIGGHFLAP